MKLNKGLLEINDTTGALASSGTVLFRAIQSANAPDATGNGVEYNMLCNVENIDVRGNYDHTTGIFTAPDTWMYRFGVVIPLTYIEAAHDRCRVRLNINAGTYYADITDFDIGSAYEKVSGDTKYTICKGLDIYLTANDTVKLAIKVENGTQGIYILGTGGNFGAAFSGYKLAV